jgi:S-adenosylmethionine hydrolase
MPRVITFLTDYGHDDDFVGVCHGVMAGIAPDARVLDVTHGIPRHDIRSGALVLRRALPYFPAGVHVAVVDPEVGAERRAVALRTAEDDRVLVGPDNGLLIPAAQRFGGVAEAVEITRSTHRLEPTSATFHGRDVFAPVAARLAAGDPLGEAGDPFAPADLVSLELPEARVENGEVIAHALANDRYGNVILDVAHGQIKGSGLKLGGAVEVDVAGAVARARFATTFADVAPGELLVYEDAQRNLALAVNRGSALGELGLTRDAELRLRPVRG